MSKTKLELTWIGKDHCPKLEPRILLEDETLSFHSDKRRESDIFDNILVHGDNLLTLKALESNYSNQIKCVYIDPPFNTQQAFEHYDDGLEHSIWLSLMRDRIELLHALLKEDGTFAIHIDDNELGYIIPLCDEIFGRSNRLYIITFKQSSVSGPKAANPGIVTIANYIILYAKDKSVWAPNRVLQPAPRDRRYTKFIDNISDHPGKWRLTSLRAAVEQSIPPTELETLIQDKEKFEECIYRFVIENASRVVRTARVKDKDVNENARIALRMSRETKDVVFQSAREKKATYYFINGEQLIFYSNKIKSEGDQQIAGVALSNIWDDLLSNNLHNEGGVSFPKGKKPEALLKRIIELTTRPGDWVLDSFAGSGTTGAAAHKMGRRWIMVELGEHCVTHIVPRMQSVIAGTDAAGISEATGWRGGGGYRYYRLAPSLLEKDPFGQWVISKAYNAEMLTEAMCKHMGFSYAPSPDHYWMHGFSSESDFLYVTTNSLTHEQLRAISSEVGPDRTLKICCKAFQSKNLRELQNLTLVKIPSVILDRCEWGKDDYSLKIENLPIAEDIIELTSPVTEPTGSNPRPKRAAERRQTNEGALSLFGEDEK